MSSLFDRPSAWPGGGGEPDEVEADAQALQRSRFVERLRAWLVQAGVGSSLLAGGGAWLLSVLAIGLSHYPGQVAALWYTNVWGLAWLLVAPLSRWPVLLLALGLGVVTANLGSGDGLGFSLALVPPNLIEMALGAALLRQHGRWPELTFSAAVGLQVMVRAALLPALVGAVAASLLVVAFALPVADVGLFALTWVESSLTGAATLLPLTLALLVSELDELRATWRDPLVWGYALLSLGVALFAVLLLPFPFV